MAWTASWPRRIRVIDRSLGVTDGLIGIRDRTRVRKYFCRGNPRQLLSGPTMDHWCKFIQTFLRLVVLMSSLASSLSINLHRCIVTSMRKIGLCRWAYTYGQYGHGRVADLRRMAKITLGRTGLLLQTLNRISTRIDLASLGRVLDHGK